MINFASITPNFFLLPLKNPQKFLDHSPVICVKNWIVEIEFVVETKIKSDWVTWSSRNLIWDETPKTSAPNHAYDAYRLHAYDAYEMHAYARLWELHTYDAYDLHAYARPMRDAHPW